MPDQLLLVPHLEPTTMMAGCGFLLDPSLMPLTSVNIEKLAGTLTGGHTATPVSDGAD